jgi:hypothetical protein
MHRRQIPARLTSLDLLEHIIEVAHQRHTQSAIAQGLREPCNKRRMLASAGDRHNRATMRRH